ncbi:MAG TPA: YceI family protein [Acidobacteriaceae bacterium]|nr:YceI family protein [Acidobacteriaceae bacterium]
MRLRVGMSLGVLLTTYAVAQAPSKPGVLDFKLDPSTTAIHWTLGATAHTVHGTFRLTSGSFRIDRTTHDVTGLIVIDATSGESGDSARDRRMHREIIQSDKFPSITFHPMHVNGTVDFTAPGPVTITVDGVMNLRGQDHPLQLPLTLRKNGSAVTAESRFEIPYVAWGLKDPSTFILRVEKRVHIDLTTLAVPTAAVAP